MLCRQIQIILSKRNQIRFYWADDLLRNWRLVLLSARVEVHLLGSFYENLNKIEKYLDQKIFFKKITQCFFLNGAEIQILKCANFLKKLFMWITNDLCNRNCQIDSTKLFAKISFFRRKSLLVSFHSNYHNLLSCSSIPGNNRMACHLYKYIDVVETSSRYYLRIISVERISLQCWQFIVFMA